MRKLLLALLLVSGPAWAQNPQCPTRPAGNSTNACASTAFVTGAITTATTLTSAHIFVGNVSNVATDVAMSGDVTISNAGFTTLASVISAGGPIGSATVAPIITYDAKGRLTAVTTATITPAIGSITGLGTGVATALAVNVGTAGAIVVNGGVLGTPSSGTLTNTTGLPISTGVSGLGTGVATAAAINLGSAGALAGLNVAQSFTQQQTITFDAGGLALLKIIGTGTNTANGYISLDGTASKQTGFNLLDGGAVKWQFIKQTDNTFLIFDAVNSVNMATYTPGVTGAGFISYANTTAATSAATGALRSAGGVGVAGALWAGTYLATTVTTVAGLPSCGAGIKGARMFVNDNNTALAFAAVITTGGAIQTPVYCDGTVWRQG